MTFPYSYQRTQDLRLGGYNPGSRGDSTGYNSGFNPYLGEFNLDPRTSNPSSSGYNPYPRQFDSDPRSECDSNPHSEDNQNLTGGRLDHYETQLVPRSAHSIQQIVQTERGGDHRVPAADRDDTPLSNYRDMNKALQSPEMSYPSRGAPYDQSDRSATSTDQISRRLPSLQSYLRSEISTNRTISFRSRDGDLVEAQVIEDNTTNQHFIAKEFLDCLGHPHFDYEGLPLRTLSGVFIPPGTAKLVPEIQPHDKVLLTVLSEPVQTETETEIIEKMVVEIEKRTPKPGHPYPIEVAESMPFHVAEERGYGDIVLGTASSATTNSNSQVFLVFRSKKSRSRSEVEVAKALQEEANFYIECLKEAFENGQPRPRKPPAYRELEAEAKKHLLWAFVENIRREIDDEIRELERTYRRRGR